MDFENSRRTLKEMEQDFIRRISLVTLQVGSSKTSG